MTGPGGAAGQTFIEFTIPTANSSPHGITLGPDCNLWFAEYMGQKIGRVTTTGTFTEFAVPGTYPIDIEAGPDGNLWFVEYGGNKIGRITPTGAITEFTIPTASSGPAAIVAGPDGNLWFTESSVGKIGRVTTAGVITEFPLPLPSSGPQGLGVGPDGNLWFVETPGSKIGRITPAGVITEFPTPTANSGPNGMAAGADGNLWFAEFNAHNIGRSTPAGVITEFSVPTAGSSPVLLALGRDGNVWFTEYYGNKIGRITPTGVITEFTVPTASSVPLDITAGPDGNLWFTEMEGNKIGRINLSAGSGGATGGGGAGGTGGSAGAGGGTATFPSCMGLAPTCGPNRDQDCCSSPLVPGGTFNRSNDPNYPATVSPFRLDTYTVTVGRFRKFIAAYFVNGWRPSPGQGKNPHSSQDAGWVTAWDANLTSDINAGLASQFKCDGKFPTWTDTAGANENLPMSCPSWYEAFAFCAWDGGRIVTEAEYNFASAGGTEQRFYPWSNPPSDTTIDSTYLSYNCMSDGSATGNCAASDVMVVGSRPKGNGRWGHADLAGNLLQWTRDWNGTYQVPCNDCAQTTTADMWRLLRGGSYSYAASYQTTAFRYGFYFGYFRSSEIGFRCARAP